jgi:hypothetical protein
LTLRLAARDRGGRTLVPGYCYSTCMSPKPTVYTAPRARPVPEASLDPLLARADELATAWVIALILMRPLERIGEFDLESLARETPALCAQVIRALASDVELERLIGRGAGGRDDSAPARKLSALAGAQDAESAVEAVEALRGVVWEALLDELHGPLFATRRVADLADRLAYVCAMALAATIGTDDTAAVKGGVSAASAVTAGKALGTPAGGALLVDERDELPAAGDAPGASQESGLGGGRQSDIPPRPWDTASSSSPVSSDSPGSAGSSWSSDSPRSSDFTDPPEGWQAPIRPFPLYTPPAAADSFRAPPSQAAVGATSPGRGSRAPRATAEPEIEIRDERGEELSSAWIVSIGHELERFEQTQLPFAVLLVELGDSERLRHAALPGGILSLTSQVERVLDEALQRVAAASDQGGGRPIGSLTSERPGRYWLLAPHTDAQATRRLAEWLLRAVRPLTSRRWAPVDVTIGTAVCPDDGRDAAALAAQADAGLYVTRAAERSNASLDESV